MDSKYFKYKKAVITDKNRSRIEVTLLENGRVEKRFFLNKGEQAIMTQLKEKEKVIVILNTMAPNRVQGVGAEDSLHKILVPGDPEFEKKNDLKPK